MVDLEAIELRVGGQDLLEQLAQPGDVPGAVAELVDDLTLGVGRRDAEGFVECPIGRDHPKLPVEDDERLAHGLHDALEVRLRLAKNPFRLLDGGDVRESQNNAADRVRHGAIRQRPHQVPRARRASYLTRSRDERLQHLACVIHEGRTLELRGDIREGAPQVGRDQVGHGPGGRREALDVQIGIQEDRGRVRAVEQVL